MGHGSDSTTLGPPTDSVDETQSQSDSAVESPEEPPEESNEESWLLAAAAAPAVALKRDASPVRLPPGTKVSDHYEIEGVLGAGGMGVVYRAHDLTLGRSVALKLHLYTDERSRDRLLREAKIMAKLSHPNVLAVHEVGTFEEQVYLAAELVEGTTVRQWAKHPRPWQEVVRLYIDAGLGLAAAHAIGLVHRDFKPDNVLVGDDGRVRVADFGLARPAGTTEGGRLQQSLSASSDADSVSAMSSLTKTGARVGTPAYMAPEQFLGEELDGRADQFAFCVSMFESLFGVRPFPGKKPAAVAASIGRGPVQTPATKRVPRHLRRVIERGLRAELDDRFASMEELIAELERSVQPRRRWRWLVVAAALGVAGVALPQVKADECRDARAALGTIWSEDRRTRLQEAMASRNNGEVEWGAVDRLAQQYVDAWGAAREAICRDRTGLTPSLRERGYACLDAGRREFDAQLAALEESSPAGAIDRFRGLVQPRECRDASLLVATVALPADESARPAIEAMRTEVARYGAGAFGGATETEVLARLDTLAEEAKAYDYGPLDTEILFAKAWCTTASSPVEAAALYEQTYFAARAAKYHRYSTAAAYKVAHLTGVAIGRVAPALTWGKIAVTEAEQEGVPLADVVDADLILGIVYDTAGDWNAAQAQYDRALARLDPEQDVHAVARAGILISVSGLEGARGHVDEAIAAGEEALAIFERLYDAPTSAMSAPMGNIGYALHAVGRYREAYEWHGRALRLDETLYGKSTHHSVTTLINLAVAAQELGEDDLAHEHYAEAERLTVTHFGEEHPDVALIASNLAHMAEAEGNADEATRLRKKALKVFQATVGPRADTTLLARLELAQSQLDRGEADVACPIADEVAALTAAEQGETRVLAVAAELQGNCARVGGDAESAIERFTEAARVREATEAPVDVRVRVQLSLADALWSTEPRRVEDAFAAAQRARALVNADPEAREADRVDAWFDRHAAP